jgi:hypothetical protein
MRKPEIWSRHQPASPPSAVNYLPVEDCASTAANPRPSSWRLSRGSDAGSARASPPAATPLQGQRQRRPSIESDRSLPACRSSSLNVSRDKPHVPPSATQHMYCRTWPYGIKRAAYGSASVVWLVSPVAFPLGPNPLAARGLAAVLARAGPAKSGHHTRLRLPPITQCSVAVCDDASKGCHSAGRRLHFLGRGSSMPRRRRQGRSPERDGDKCVGLTTIGGGQSTPGARQPVRVHPAHPGGGRGCGPSSGCGGGLRPGRGGSG